MRMLGFTGTRSLYCSSSHYITHGTTTPEASGAIILPQVRSRGGGGLVSNDCVDRLQNCYIDCAVKYPDSPGNLNSEMRQGCEILPCGVQSLLVVWASLRGTCDLLNSAIGELDPSRMPN